MSVWKKVKKFLLAPAKVNNGAAAKQRKQQVSQSRGKRDSAPTRKPSSGSSGSKGQGSSSGGNIYSYRDKKVAAKAKKRAPNVSRMKRGGLAFDNAKSAYSQAVNKKAESRKFEGYKRPDSHKQGSSVSSSTKRTQERSTYKTAGGRAYTGFVRNALMAGLPEVKHKEIKDTKSYKAGAFLGDIVGYGVGYGAVGGATKKAGQKIATTALGKKAAAKVATTKTAMRLATKELETQGKKVTAEAVESLAKKKAKSAVELAGKNLVADATMGTALDLARAKGDKIKGKDLAKYMGLNAAMNVGVGGVMDVAPALIKASRAGKAIKAAKAEERANAVKAFKADKRDKSRLMLGGAEKGAEEAHKTAREALRNKDFSQWARKELAKSDVSLDVIARDTGKTKAAVVKDLKKRYDAQKLSRAYEGTTKADRQLARLNDVRSGKTKQAQTEAPSFNDAKNMDLRRQIRQGGHVPDRKIRGRLTGRYQGLLNANSGRVDLGNTRRRARIVDSSNRLPSGRIARPTRLRRSERESLLSLVDERNVSENRALYEDAISRAKKAKNAEEADKILYDTARSLAEDGRYYVPRDGEDETLQDIAKELRTRRFRVEHAADLVGKGESLSERGKKVFGKNSVTEWKPGDRSSWHIDQQYQELQDMYGKSYFPDVDNSTDQMEVIFDLMETARSSRERGANGIRFTPDDAEEATYRILDDLYQRIRNDKVSERRAGRSVANPASSRKQAMEAMKDTEFVKALRHNMRERNTTVAKAAERMGVDRATYMRLEHSHYKADKFYNAGKRTQSEIEDTEEFMKQVHEFIRGEMPSGRLLTVGRMPEILKKYGATADYLAMPQKTVSKAAYPDNYLGYNRGNVNGHNLGFGAFYYLNRELSNPLAVLKSTNKEGRKTIVVFTRMLDADDKPVIAPIHLNKGGVISYSDQIPSLHGRDIEQYLRAHEEEVVYLNKKGLSELHSNGLQLSEAKRELDPIHRIQQTQPDVKAPGVGGGGGTLSAAKAGDLSVGETSKAAETLYNSPIQNEESRRQIQEMIDDGTLSKYTRRNATADADAVRAIRDNGADKVAENIHMNIMDGKAVGQNDIAKGYRLIEEYVSKGDYAKANEVMADVVTMASELGRGLQTMRMFRALTPEGRVASVMRNVERLKGKKDADITIPDDLLNRLRNATDDKEITEANKAIAKHIWDQIPATWGEKLNAWRYLAMLGNPRTHIRNILGNAIFVPFRATSGILSTGLEKTLLPAIEKRKIAKYGAEAFGERGHAILTHSKADRDLINLGKQDFDGGVGDVLRNNTKYVENSTKAGIGARPEDSPVFKSKILNTLSKLNAAALDKEDVWFMRPAYAKNFAQYMKANGHSAENATAEIIEAAREYAGEQALRATYRDASVASDMLSRVKRYSGAKLSEIPETFNGGNTEKLIKKAGAIAIESMVPFTKTPINILRRGFDYSPAGIIKAGYRLGTAKDSKTLLRGIENLATGMTGTALMAFGAWMGHSGIAQGAIDYNSPEGSYKNLQGIQEYSITIGDNNYTMDWAAPVCLPFFIGVEYGNARSGDEFSKVASTLQKVTDPIFNLSMLQGLNNAFNTEFSMGNSLVENTKNIGKGYLGQYLPTIGGQISRTMQKTATGTTSTNPDTTMRGWETWANQMKNKVPGLANTNAPRVDNWGEKETKKDAKDYAKAALQNFVSPGYGRKVKTSRVDRELNSLIEKGASSDILPSSRKTKADYEYKIGGKDVRLTPKEYQQFRVDAGQTAKKELRDLFNSDSYKDMSLEEKQKAIANVYTDAKLYAKKKLFESKGYTPTDIAWEFDLTKSQREKYGSKREFTKTLKDAGLTLKEYQKMSKSGVTIKQYLNAKEHGVSVDKYVAATKAIDKAKGYGGRTAALLEGGYIKNFDQAKEVYDIKEQSWNAAVTLLNQGYSSSDIIKIDGDYDADHDAIKEYGTMGNGWITKEGLYKWTSKQKPPKGVKISTKAYRAYLWRTHGVKWWQDENPYE